MDNIEEAEKSSLTSSEEEIDMNESERNLKASMEDDKTNIEVKKQLSLTEVVNR